MRVKMTFVAAALAGLLTMLLSGTAAADVIKVSSGESIQAAIDKADPGDTIKVGPGTYKESLLIKTDDINLVGSGRKATKIVPPDNPTVGQGCVFSVQFEPPPAPPVTLVNGVCAANVDADFNVISQVDDVQVSRLAVSGFPGIGIFFVGTRDGVIQKVLSENNGEYGIFANTASGTTIARNLTAHNGEAGVYVGDSPEADATVWRNVSWDNNNGIFIRDAAHGKVLDNKVFSNCVGVLFLNTDETAQQPPADAIDLEDWLAKGNDATANNKACGGGGDEPPFSGIGIAVVSGSDVKLIANGAFGNKPASAGTPFSGGIAVVGDPSFKPSSNVKVGFNSAFGNEPDLLWDQQGSGNSFFGNDCLTSQPDGLCEEPSDQNGNGGGNDGSGGDDNHHGQDRGHGKDKGGHAHKHGKHHKKHGKKHRHKRD
jgi:hypothetical protein